jgi:hypothetical protein
MREGYVDQEGRVCCVGGHNVGRAILTRGKRTIVLEGLTMLTRKEGLLRWRTQCGRLSTRRKGSVALEDTMWEL